MTTTQTLKSAGAGAGMRTPTPPWLAAMHAIAARFGRTPIERHLEQTTDRFDLERRERAIDRGDDRDASLLGR